MGKQRGPHFITGTVGNLTFYRLDGQYLVRAKSSLSRKRVKRSPAFRRTMAYAELLGRASRLAAKLYRSIPRKKQRVEVYRAMTGAAMGLFKQGMEEEPVRAKLMADYVHPRIKAAQPREKAPATAKPAPPKPPALRPRKYVPLFSPSRFTAERRRRKSRINPSQSVLPARSPGSCCGRAFSRRALRGGKAPSLPAMGRRPVHLPGSPSGP